LCDKKKGKKMTRKVEIKLARIAKAYYRDQMDLPDWLMVKAEEQEVLKQTE
jgi:hypothetical protein